ncbi:hypothetical protein BIV25_37690 [Streptomyces sp. MUSC 14]|uniref:hypothetical protein n=1 Tax=Streptomyces sp. MUSC 14 TaxID=1354889 RepID=UPI0008F57D6F|nr:hypothetical protein [Streptomyces sp. MUSC 14]OIJ87703.1 hypothetical protein BIV25_37690 [Streptomyces sp. MUSC 14]
MERRDLRALADRGVLLTSRAVEAGWPRRGLTRALRAKGWTQLRRGAWAEPGRDPDLLTRLRAVLFREPRLIVSHGSAAALWRIELLGGSRGSRKAPLEFIDPELTLRRMSNGVRVHRLLLDPADVVERQGLRLTNPTRTVTDLLRRGPRNEAVVAVDSALTYRRVGHVRRALLTRWDDVVAALESAGQAQGSVRARRWLRLCDPRAGSPAETVARLRMYDAALHPESQAELRTPEGRHRTVDFLFRAAGLGVEIEGYAYRGTRDAHRQDIARFNQLLRCPEIRGLLRFSAEDVFHRPAYMVEEIRATLADLTGVGPTASCLAVRGRGDASAPRLHARQARRLRPSGGEGRG